MAARSLSTSDLVAGAAAGAGATGGGGVGVGAPPSRRREIFWSRGIDLPSRRFVVSLRSRIGAAAAGSGDGVVGSGCGAAAGSGRGATAGAGRGAAAGSGDSAAALTVGAGCAAPL